MSLKERLEEELKDVAFSEEQQERLKARLLLAVEVQHASGVTSRLKRFWNGSTEIPLPLAVAAAVLVAIGIWGSFYPILSVDQSQAALLLQTAGESVRVINQGVSIL